ncbi:MAG: peptidyl-tRNA hydrolase [Anaerolineaceae bacterium]
MITGLETLYILMRTDLASMNPGKACAQACHAANMFVHEVESRFSERDRHDLIDWSKQTIQGFGTTIVLGADWDTIAEKVHFAINDGFVAGIVRDPTYPIRDGEVTHLIPLDTCAYIFVRDRTDPKAVRLLGDMELHA